MTWSYVEPTSATDPTPVTITMTEPEILAAQYPWWARRAMEWNAQHRDLRQIPITPQACIEDWAVVHWASRVEK
jgi:hypothetical protein